MKIHLRGEPPPPAIRMGELVVPPEAFEDPLYWQCVDEVIRDLSILNEFDRLLGTSFAKRLSPIETCIDKVTGKEQADVVKLLVAVWRAVYVPLANQQDRGML